MSAFFKEIEKNFFVYGNKNIIPTCQTEYFCKGYAIRTVDETISLPYKKIRIRYPDYGTDWRFPGVEFVYYSEIPKVSSIILLDGTTLEYHHWYARGRNVRNTSLCCFLNSLYGNDFSTIESISNKEYQFVIEFGNSSNGYPLLTPCSEFVARLYKDKSNYEIIKKRNETSLYDKNGIRCIKISNKSVDKYIGFVQNGCIFTPSKFIINSSTESPYALFSDCTRTSNALVSLSDALRALSQNPTHWHTEYYNSAYLFLRLCEYYTEYFKSQGIKVVKKRIKDILAGWGFNTHKEVNNETRAIAMSELLSLIIELTGTNKTKVWNKKSTRRGHRRHQSI